MKRFGSHRRNRLDSERARLDDELREMDEAARGYGPRTTAEGSPYFHRSSSGNGVDMSERPVRASELASQRDYMADEAALNGHMALDHRGVINDRSRPGPELSTSGTSPSVHDVLCAQVSDLRAHNRDLVRLVDQQEQRIAELVGVIRQLVGNKG